MMDRSHARASGQRSGVVLLWAWWGVKNKVLANLALGVVRVMRV